MTVQDIRNDLHDAEEIIQTALKELTDEQKKTAADILLGMSLAKKAAERR